MLRGNERKPVFLDEEDKNKFVKIMLQKRETTTSKLYAYCVMDNHVHMAIHEIESGQPLDVLMKRIGISYAVYFNKKYKRVGHVFQDRFRSEVIEEEDYLLSVIRYIHQNPVKAGLPAGKEYAWSSYSWYMGHSRQGPLLPEMESILDMLSLERISAIKQFRSFHAEEEQQIFAEMETEGKTEYDVESILVKFLSMHKLTKEELKRKENRSLAANLVRDLARVPQLSGRQIGELTGLNREMVRKMIVSVEPSP